MAFTAWFSEPVSFNRTAVDLSASTAGGVSIVSITGANTNVYTIHVRADSDGQIVLAVKLAGHGVADPAGNALDAAFNNTARSVDYGANWTSCALRSLGCPVG